LFQVGPQQLAPRDFVDLADRNLQLAHSRRGTTAASR